MSEKRVIDKEGIEREYRAGVRSVREIGAEFGVSHTLICRWARDEGWERDLAAKIRAKADALVSKEAVSSLVTVETRAAEKAIVEANAAAIVTIRLRHRTDIKRGIDQCGRLVSYLESAAVDAGGVRDFATTLKQWADTHKSLVVMEREAWGIAPAVELVADKPASSPSNPMEDARRVAFILSRAAALPAPKA
jgi:transposase